MSDIEKIQLFEDQKVRTIWVESDEKWYFSIKDVILILAEAKDPKDYLSKMRRREPELAKGWGQIVHPPCCTHPWRPSEREFRQSGRNVPHYPVHSLQKGRAVQAMDGPGCSGADQSDHRPGAKH